MFNEIEERAKRFEKLYKAQRIIYGHKDLNHHKLLKCFRWQRPMTQGKVGVAYSLNTGKAMFDNLMVCDSVWLCPVCSYKILGKRAEEIRKGAEWAINQGYSLVMLTFTHSHHKGETLEELAEKHKKALSKFRAGKAGKNLREKIGFVGRITSNEVTYGDNGWHYHSHVLYIVSDADKVKDNEINLKLRWMKMLRENGLKASSDNGLNFLYCENEDIGGYMSKWGIDKELAGGNKKDGGKSPFELLEDKADYHLFLEYALYFGTHKRDRIRWFNGLKKKAGIEEKTDKEITELTEEERNDIKIVISIGIDNWKLVCSKGYQSKVLELIERQKGGVDLLNRWLVSIGGSMEYEDWHILNTVA